MKIRKLGTQGLQVPSIGLGCMGMSYAYGKRDDNESLRVLEHALALGINFWDTAELYGPYTNESLLGRALKGQSRDKVIIATKFGFKLNDKGEVQGVISTPSHIRKSIEGSLSRLGTDYIDLYYQHRLDPNTPIEDTVGAMAELVKEGKVRYLGLSEVGPATIRRAHSVHPISAIQSEYSLWERTVEAKVLPCLRSLGIGFVPFSPIGRGFLTNKLKSLQDLDSTDWRHKVPRFQGENLEHNLKLVATINKIALAHKATVAQVAIAWLLKQGEDIVPIPGTKRMTYLQENVKAVDLTLPDSPWLELNEAIDSFKPAGDRYAKETMAWIDTSE